MNLKKIIIIIIVAIVAKHGIISLIADLDSNGIHIHTLLCLVAYRRQNYFTQTQTFCEQTLKFFSIVKITIKIIR